MRVSTIAFGNKRVGGVRTQPPSEFSSHASSKIRVCLPSSILHLEPQEINFLDLKMLFQAKDPEEEFASKIEQLLKYLALNTT